MVTLQFNCIPVLLNVLTYGDLFRFVKFHCHPPMTTGPPGYVIEVFLRFYLRVLFLHLILLDEIKAEFLTYACLFLNVERWSFHYGGEE
jgi:hypothetical protein